MKQWAFKRIDELGIIVTGKTPSSNFPDEFGEENPFITPSDIPKTQKVIKPERYLSKKGKDKLKRIVLPPKSTCVVCIGATIGKTCMTQMPSVSNQQINTIIPNQKNDNHFVYYIATTLKDSLVSFAGGSATPIINKSAFSSIKVKVPLFTVQQKIAAILTGYDDLIENNNRRIAILEKMAEEIYREWFVRMRFPGHEKAKFTKGMPDGWSIKKLRDTVQRKNFGRIYREYDLTDVGQIVVIDQSKKDFLGYYDGEPEHLASSENPIILFGDHSCKMVLMTEAFSLAENVIPFTSKENMPVYYLYYLVKGQIETQEYKRHWTELTNKDILVAEKNLQTRFSEITQKLFLKIIHLKKMNQNLIKTRDLLLPRLISGKLSVEDLDIHFPPSMEPEHGQLHQ